MNELSESIVTQIKNRGPITFAEFMQMALYCPNYGFYEREKDTIGRRGDFYTSVSVGELFGELLARKFAQWLGESEEDQVITKSTERQRKSRRASSSKPPKSARWQIVEAGAHDGRLARDILLWLKEYQPEIFERVEYWIIEPSKRAKVRHGITLGGFERKIRWLAGIEELEAVRGIIFSNELLDAMPVHRVSWDAKSRQWFEWGVGWEQGKFEWVRLENANEAGATRRSRSSKLPASIPRQLQLGSTWLGHLPDPLLDVLPDGFTTEICPGAVDWWRDAAHALKCGRLMTIDYGFGVEELIVPERKHGTLRAYRKHRLSNDVLANPGEQDLTAHVNFTSLQEAGEKAGLVTELFETQSRFLTSIVARSGSGDRSAGDWAAGTTRQFHTLTNPEHLGQRFRVLVQRRS